MKGKLLFNSLLGFILTISIFEISANNLQQPDTVIKVSPAQQDHELTVENTHNIADLQRQLQQIKGQNQGDLQLMQQEIEKLAAEKSKLLIAFVLVAAILLLVIVILAYLVKQVKVRTQASRNIQSQRLKSLQDRIKEMNEGKARFFANVSHDLRTPLSLIFGSLDILSEDDDSILSQSSLRNLDIALKNCKRLLYLTDEINDLTKLEEGSLGLQKEVVSVSMYMRMLTDIFGEPAKNKGIKLALEEHVADKECIEIDPRQFEKIFYCLITNSIRFTDEGGEILVTTRRDVRKVIIEVSDTGDGIPEESMPYIFDRFYQVKGNPYRSREGLGIGLALVKELVKLHGGEVSVKSALGVGTTFQLVFYIAEGVGEQFSKEKLFSQIQDRKTLYKDLDKGQNAGISLPKKEENLKSILLVDDHPEIRYHLRQVLEDTFHVIEAAHGLEAMDILKAKKVDLIISDLMMPWMDGFELLKAINENDEFNKIPILVVSARISEEDQQKVLYQGVNDYLKKPFHKSELIQRINNMLGQKEKWEQGESGFALLSAQQNHESFGQDILTKVESLVMDKIADANLSVYDLADAMAASERQVYRLMKEMTGLTPHEYITEIRLKYADFLIRKGKVKNASEAARSIGMKNVTTFNRQYEKKYGVKPSTLF